MGNGDIFEKYDGRGRPNGFALRLNAIQRLTLFTGRRHSHSHSQRDASLSVERRLQPPFRACRCKIQ